MLVEATENVEYMVYPHTVCGWVFNPVVYIRSWISLVVSGQSRNTEEVYIYIRTYSGYPNITCSPIHSLLRIPIEKIWTSLIRIQKKT